MTAMPKLAGSEPDRRENVDAGKRSGMEPASRVEPLAVDAKALAGLIGISVRTIRTHDAGGKLPRGVRIGGRKVWIVDEIKRWLESGAPNRATWEAMKGSASKFK
ncbi:MAG: hypothetical protein AABZ47_05695 [Planctomycetota bacterium]